MDNNGNNSLASVPLMILVYLFVPVAATAWGYLFGAFFLMVCLAVLLTNQFHKWAHMERPPGWVRRLQLWGLVLTGCPYYQHKTRLRYTLAVRALSRACR